ncbi:MAG: TIGR00159 family protein [Rhodobacterales bacterium]|nr:TIGR00159 family protein [Rhodobacterales bacterium]
MNAISNWFQNSLFVTIDLSDWLDIALLTFIIYRVLILMRGTRALQSLLGLTLVVVLYGLSEWMGLVTVHWVLDHMFVYIVLALLILFQEDIRRALARAGGTFFSQTYARPNDAKVLEQVVKVLFALAHRKIGALIVLERQASLEPYLEGAHPIDAVLSTELLQSIFHPSSPLHDGAVIISKQRIVAAGVFLPISLSKQIARTYGTRHRAAIGIPEATDGICLVVSEERGTVAMVHLGEIVPVADANELRQLLTEELERSASKLKADAPAPGATHAS